MPDVNIISHSDHMTRTLFDIDSKEYRVYLYCSKILTIVLALNNSCFAFYMRDQKFIHPFDLFAGTSLMLYLLFAHPQQNETNNLNVLNQSNYHFHASMENSNTVTKQSNNLFILMSIWRPK